MNVLVRQTGLILVVWLVLVGVCFGKQVYLKDGGIIDSQSAWRKGDKVFVKVNRDIVAEFNQNEIDLRRTFPHAGPSHHAHRKIAAVAPIKTAAVVPAPATPAQTQVVTQPAPKPVATSAPMAAPVVKESAQPVVTPAAPVETAALSNPPDKAELDRRKQEAVKMMTEAAMKKDPELMKKALEMQKSAMPQPGSATQANTGVSMVVLLIILAVSLLIVVAHWVLFERAGQAGWKCLIPFYNMYILMQIAGKPGWWMFLLIIPLVGVVIYFLAMLSLAKMFRRSELFGVGIFILPMIFLPVLAFGGSQYEG